MTNKTAAERRSENLGIFFERGAGLYADYNTWIIARDRKRARVLTGGLGGLGVGEMWCVMNRADMESPDFADAPERDSWGGFGTGDKESEPFVIDGGIEVTALCVSHPVAYDHAATLAEHLLANDYDGIRWKVVRWHGLAKTAQEDVKEHGLFYYRALLQPRDPTRITTTGKSAIEDFGNPVSRKRLIKRVMRDMEWHAREVESEEMIVIRKRWEDEGGDGK